MADQLGIVGIGGPAPAPDHAQLGMLILSQMYTKRNEKNLCLGVSQGEFLPERKGSSPREKEPG